MCFIVFSILPTIISGFFVLSSFSHAIVRLDSETEQLWMPNACWGLTISIAMEDGTVPIKSISVHYHYFICSFAFLPAKQVDFFLFRCCFFSFIIYHLISKCVRNFLRQHWFNSTLVVWTRHDVWIACNFSLLFFHLLCCSIWCVCVCVCVCFSLL